MRERLRSFLRYCYQAEWLTRIPQVSKVQVQQDPTLPLTAAEYGKLLDTCYATFAEDKEKCARVHALLQLMRSGVVSLSGTRSPFERTGIIHDAKKKLYRVVTSRQKTGTHVSVPIPNEVADELLTVLNGNPTYVFWSGNGMEESATKNWAEAHCQAV